MLLASLTPLAIGFVYYHKALFGKALQDATGGKEGSSIGMYIAFVLTSFLLSFFLLNFNNDGINQEGDFDNFLHGAWHGAFVAITVVVPIVVMTGLREKRSWKNTFIHILYWIITLVVIGGLVDAMNHWTNIPMPEGY